MVVGKTGDLSEMRHAKHLVFFGDPLEPLTDSLGCTAPDSCVDFVEDQCPGDLRTLIHARL